MFKILSHISNVEHIQVNYNLEIIKYKNGNYCLNGETVKNYKYIGLLPNGLICQKTSDYYFIENIFSGKIIKLDASKSYSTGNVFSENGTFYTTNNTFDETAIEFRKDFYYHDFKTNEEKLLIKQGTGYFFTNYENNTKSIFRSHNTLKSLSLLTGEYEWELDLGAYGEIDKIIGVCNEILWVGVGSKMLIGIDIKYGKIMHVIDKPSHFAYQSGAFNYFRGHDGQIDEKAKKLVGFEFDTYYELDLVTMEFTYWIFREEAKAMKIEARYASQNIHTEDFIYFIDKLNFKIGIFDRKNKTIKEAYVFPENSCTGFLNDLQVTNDKMYVLDTGGTLHILKKERA
ncbi:hypothetical protein [Cellulophaga sp. BC115SP]|uniref:hypothetical protein n=1 Tax=Cellulophaga sp. BC115SP TaxID=2683263 RepID=UPI001411DF77|nr:hypothetical protein [Cellulophaga sp. BC115SP]NBB32049.1 hypothetical protein [Cellulophaga sp. BC115SP]